MPSSFPTSFIGGGAFSFSIQDELLREENPELELSFGTEPIVGWRVWRIADYEMYGDVREKRLSALGVHEVWRPRERAVARCNRQVYFSVGVPRYHESPWAPCSCGIWVLKDRAAAEETLGKYGGNGWGLPLGSFAIGQVAIWGRVLECERGWRAQYAYPQRILVWGGDGRAADELGRLYGVEAKTLAKFPPGGAGVSDEYSEKALSVSGGAIQFGTGMQIISTVSVPSNVEIAEPGDVLAEAKKRGGPPRPRPSGRDAFKQNDWKGR